MDPPKNANPVIITRTVSSSVAFLTRAPCENSTQLLNKALSPEPESRIQGLGLPANLCQAPSVGGVLSCLLPRSPAFLSPYNKAKTDRWARTHHRALPFPPLLLSCLHSRLGSPPSTTFCNGASLYIPQLPRCPYFLKGLP